MFVSFSFLLASSTAYINSAFSISCRFLESPITLLAFGSSWVTCNFASLLLFRKLQILCFDKLVVKNLLSLTLLLLGLLDISGSNFVVLKRDSMPERLDLTSDATSIAS